MLPPIRTHCPSNSVHSTSKSLNSPQLQHLSPLTSPILLTSPLTITPIEPENRPIFFPSQYTILILHSSRSTIHLAARIFHYPTGLSGSCTIAFIRLVSFRSIWAVNRWNLRLPLYSQSHKPWAIRTRSFSSSTTSHKPQLHIMSSSDDDLPLAGKINGVNKGGKSLPNQHLVPSHLQHRYILSLVPKTSSLRDADCTCLQDHPTFPPRSSRKASTKVWTSPDRSTGLLNQVSPCVMDPSRKMWKCQEQMARMVLQNEREGQAHHAHLMLKQRAVKKIAFRWYDSSQHCLPFLMCALRRN